MMVRLFMINRFKNELNIQEWIKKANEDELSCKSILKHKDGSHSSVCFFSQQMAEKYLKILLIFHQKEFPKIHDLKRIATLIEPSVKDIFELEEEFNVLNKYYATTRYPGDFPEGFSWHDAEEAFKATRKIKEFVLKKIASFQNSPKEPPNGNPAKQTKERGFIPLWIIGITIAVIAAAGIGYLFFVQKPKAPAMPTPDIEITDLEDVKAVIGFLGAQQSRNFENAKPFLSPEFARTIDPIGFAGTSNPHTGRFEIQDRQLIADDSGETSKTNVRVYQEYIDEGNIGYNDNSYYVKLFDNRYLIDNIEYGNYVVLPKKVTSNWKTYRNEKYGFEVKYPSHYSISDSRSTLVDKSLESDYAYIDFDDTSALRVFNYKGQELKLDKITVFKQPVVGNIDGGIDYEIGFNNFPIKNMSFRILFSTKRKGFESKIEELNNILSTFKVMPTNLVNETKVFLIALDDNGKIGEKIGCGDSIVGVEKSISPTDKPTEILERVLAELFAIKTGEIRHIKGGIYINEGLYNVFTDSNLKIDSINIKNEVAEVKLSGDLALGGVCDEPRFTAQLGRIITQFPTVNSTKICVNNRPLEAILDASGRMAGQKCAF